MDDQRSATATAGRKVKGTHKTGSRSRRLEIRITAPHKKLLLDLLNDYRDEGFLVKSQADLVMQAIELLGITHGRPITDYYEYAE